MNLQRLEGFYWVAKTQGYARAARAFPYPITQPGVHQQVRRLEDELGVKLFERVGKDKVVLTTRGQVLFEAVAPFVERLPAIEAQVKGGVVGGTLKMHAAGLALRYVIPEWLRRLQNRRSDITVALSEIKTSDLSLLRTGESDLLVDWLPEVPSDVEVREVGQIAGWIVAPSHGPFAQPGKLSLSALARVPFISYHADRTLKAMQLEVLQKHDLTVNEGFSADTSETILGFVAAGLGFSLIPWLAPSGPRMAGVVALRIERPAATFPLYAAWRKRSVAHPLVEAAMSVAPV